MKDYVLLTLPDQSAELVLGMRWHTILGSRLAMRARQKAREAKASHYAHSASSSEAVGTVRFARVDRARKGVARYSGALTFAACHPQGLAASCFELPDGRVWVVAVHAGKVLTHADKVYETRADAQDALDALAARYGQALSIYGKGEEGDAELLDLAAELRPECQLQPCGLAWPAVPRPVAIAVMGCLLALGGRSAWDIYRAGGAEQSLAPEQVDGVTAWAEALAQFAGRTPVHGQADWNAVLDALADLPGDIGGWVLRSAQCKPAETKGWSCAVRYDRHSRLATNASFLGARPAQWSEIWQPLDSVTAVFSVPREFGKLDIAGLHTAERHESQTITALQQIRPALSAVAWNEPSSVRIDPPRDAAGVQIPVPLSVSRIEEHAITIEGPLRSLGLIPEELSGQITWKSVSLVIDENAEPTLNRSRLMAGMSGAVYARN